VRLRLFLDSDVLFSACLQERSRQRAFFSLARLGACTLLGLGYVLRETERNLNRKAPWALHAFADLGSVLELIDEPPQSLSDWARAQGPPEKEAPILAAAVAGRADLLVTGDRRRFGPLFGGRFRGGVRVLPLADGLAVVLAAAERRR
jgi:hypothetical protein